MDKLFAIQYKSKTNKRILALNAPDTNAARTLATEVLEGEDQIITVQEAKFVMAEQSHMYVEKAA